MNPCAEILKQGQVLLLYCVTVLLLNLALLSALMCTTDHLHAQGTFLVLLWHPSSRIPAGLPSCWVCGRAPVPQGRRAVMLEPGTATAGVRAQLGEAGSSTGADFSFLDVCPCSPRGKRCWPLFCAKHCCCDLYK